MDMPLDGVVKKQHPLRTNKKACRVAGFLMRRGRD
jgi:hypothetical protein